ncbi:hypothetical protein ACOSP7_018579 [Xanthoceras sorbifolium]
MTSSAALVDHTVQSSAESVLKRKSNDVGWEFEVLVDAKNLDKVKCILYGKVTLGGAYRMKEHVGQISGNVAACPKATPEEQAKCRNDITEGKSKKRGKRKEELLLRSQVNVVDTTTEEEYAMVTELGVMKEPRSLGPMNRFISEINPNCSLSGRSGTKRQPNICEALFKERTHKVHQYVAKWVYEAGVPFNTIANDSFKQVVKAIGQFGSGYKPPSQYQLREPLLREEWALNGCSIMTDAWSDRKRRSIMHLCVNCKIGTTFLSSKESSDKAHTGEHIFQYVDGCIEQVGPKNIIQVVTDNATNNMAAAKLLKVKRPSYILDFMCNS